LGGKRLTTETGGMLDARSSLRRRRSLITHRSRTQCTAAVGLSREKGEEREKDHSEQ